MRTSFEILKDIRSYLGLGDTVITYNGPNKAGILADVQYLRKLGQLNAMQFENYLLALGENKNDYFMLTGEKK